MELGLLVTVLAVLVSFFVDLWVVVVVIVVAWVGRAVGALLRRRAGCSHGRRRRKNWPRRRLWLPLPLTLSDSTAAHAEALARGQRSLFPNAAQVLRHTLTRMQEWGSTSGRTRRYLPLAVSTEAPSSRLVTSVPHQERVREERPVEGKQPTSQASPPRPSKSIMGYLKDVSSR